MAQKQRTLAGLRPEVGSEGGEASHRHPPHGPSPLGMARSDEPPRVPAAYGATPRGAEPAAHMHSSARPTPATCGGTGGGAAAAGGIGRRPSFGSSGSGGGRGGGGAGSVASSSLRRTSSAGAGVRRESPAAAAGSPLARPSWMPQAAMEQATVLGSRLQVRPGIFAPQDSDPARLFEALLAASGR